MVRTRRGLRILRVSILALLWATVIPSAHAFSFFYQVHNLVSDTVDPDLVNPWGIAFNPFGFVWVADNGTGTSTLYDGNGTKNGLIVTIPGGKPTGIVFSGSPTDFPVTPGNPARFIFATEHGTVAAWNPTVDRTHAIQKVDNSTAGAIYKGLALGANGSGFLLYATDFHNRHIDVFDTHFTPVTLAGSFTDSTIPQGYAPFGIQNLNGSLWVTYAKQDADAEDDVSGPGRGFVNVFDADGHLIRRVVSRIGLNAPWGLALAPADFGIFSTRLLVGNFGDGTISVYDPGTGIFLGKLHTAHGKLLVIEGLWGIAFGNGLNSQPTNVLFFAAGPGDEAHGVYGRIAPVP